jgi:hypothetical protein
MNPRESQAIRTARALLAAGHPLDQILASAFVPADLRSFVERAIHEDETFQLAPVRSIVNRSGRPDWLRGCDRSTWYFWPELRQYLLSVKGWSLPAVRSLDDASDRVLGQLAPPTEPRSDIRGLVLGFVQSGKTANYTAVIAKAVDAGYRLIIVLSGIDNGLRKQTNNRLKRELVGYAEPRPDAVRLPPIGQQWHEFTRDNIDGDFQPGWANHAALQGSQPVLMVVKKFGPVLRRLLIWLDAAPAHVRSSIPFLLIDDEADLASVDTRGTYQSQDDPPDPDYEEPSVTNGLIRKLLLKFDRRAYVAYTATPFANVLIPHDTNDPTVGNDLYPKDFIVDLPKPQGYFGAEEFFGRMDSDSGEQHGGLDVVRHVPDDDLASLVNGQLPPSLEQALVDFMLSGAARAQRGRNDAPATMLIHTSQRILVQSHLRSLVSTRFSDLRDEWRYQRGHGLRDRLSARWESDFRRVTRAAHLDKDVSFGEIEPFVGPFIEAVQVREINSATGEVLDYDREPGLKAIAVGGNRLSRGLTLEGLLVSYFIRPSANYDTLMQMGRWFGYRGDYEDLTRIYTTPELEGWFSDLAFVEHRLREDIQVYEDQELNPTQVGVRIWQHPAMQVTAALKRRFASTTTISQSYAMTVQQTFKFPLKRLEDLALQAEANLQAVRDLVRTLGSAGRLRTDAPAGPLWHDVAPETIIEFLKKYRVDEQSKSVSIPLLVKYIEKATELGELTQWIVAVRGKNERDIRLGTADWILPTGPVNQISRSRLGAADSVGVVTSPGDEAFGMDASDLAKVAEQVDASRRSGRPKSENVIARQLRDPKRGLLLLYPISRHSGYDLDAGGARKPLYLDPNAPIARDLVAFALSFPKSDKPQTVEAYVEGTVGWRPAE